jgi:hypothetical protein
MLCSKYKHEIDVSHVYSLEIFCHICHFVLIHFVTLDVFVPNMRVGRCLGPEGNGVSSEEEGEGGPGSPSREDDKQSTPIRKEARWSRRRKEGRARRDEEEPVCTE